MALVTYRQSNQSGVAWGTPATLARYKSQAKGITPSLHALCADGKHAKCYAKPGRCICECHK